MVVYCYCQIPSNATLNNQCIRRKRLVASCSLRGLFPEKLYHLDISNEKERLLLKGFFQKASKLDAKWLALGIAVPLEKSTL